MLQNVVQADAAHINFGKYTLYSAYGNTANANMSLIAFAIIFGNEDCAGWTNSGIALLALIQVLTQAKSRSLLIERRDRLPQLKSVSLEPFIFTAQFIVKRTSPARSK